MQEVLERAQLVEQQPTQFMDKKERRGDKEQEFLELENHIMQLKPKVKAIRRSNSGQE